MSDLAQLNLKQVLDALEAHYGPQMPDWPVEPFQFLVWWHCGYPASDAACGKGWSALGKVTTLVTPGVTQVRPDEILAAKPAQLAAGLKSGGMVPELRAERLQEIAARVLGEFDGDLQSALRQMPLAKARAALRTFPGIADAGADRILLFAGISPVAAIPSNRAGVLLRIFAGREDPNWGKTYRAAQEIVAAEVPAKFDLRTRAYLLLKRHGQEVCKLTNPKCAVCPVAASCTFVKR